MSTATLNEYEFIMNECISFCAPVFVAMLRCFRCNIRENSCSCHFETFMIDEQWYWDDAVTFTRWQHHAMQCCASVPVIVCVTYIWQISLCTAGADSAVKRLPRLWTVWLHLYNVIAYFNLYCKLLQQIVAIVIYRYKWCLFCKFWNM